MVDLLGSSVRSDALRSVPVPLKRLSSLLLSGGGGGLKGFSSDIIYFFSPSWP